MPIAFIASLLLLCLAFVVNEILVTKTFPLCRCALLIPGIFLCFCFVSFCFLRQVAVVLCFNLSLCRVLHFGLCCC